MPVAGSFGALGVGEVQGVTVSLVEWGHSEQNRVWCEKYYRLLSSPVSRGNVLVFCVLANPKAELPGPDRDERERHPSLRAHIKVLTVPLPSARNVGGSTVETIMFQPCSLLARIPENYQQGRFKRVLGAREGLLR